MGRLLGSGLRVALRSPPFEKGASGFSVGSMVQKSLLIETDNEHDHRFAEHEHTRKRRTSSSGFNAISTH